MATPRPGDKPASRRQAPVPASAAGPGSNPTPSSPSASVPSATGAILERTDIIEVPPIPGADAVRPPSGSSDGLDAPTPLDAATARQDQGTVVTVESAANLMLEYLASTYPTLTTQFGTPHGLTQAAGIHVLPLYIDELEQDFGTDMYLRMLLDAQIKACDATLRDAVLSRPLQVLAYEDERMKKAEQEQMEAQRAAMSAEQQAKVARSSSGDTEGTGASERPQEGSKGTGAGKGPKGSAKFAAGDTEAKDGNKDNGGAGKAATGGQYNPAQQAKPPVAPPGAGAAEREFAGEVADFVRANLDQLPEGFGLVSRELLEGIALGYKLAEQVYEIREIIPGNGPQTCIKSINPKPHEAVSIVVDQYNNELGYIPRSASVGLWGSFFAGDLGVSSVDKLVDPQGQEKQEVEIPGLVPPDKVVPFVWQRRNGDPRGTSHLRAAYVPWRLKIGLYPAYEAYLARFAQPSTALELEGGDAPAMAASDGRLITDPVQKLTALLTNLRNFQAGGAMVVPNGHINMLQATSNGEAYLKAFELVNQEITKSILLQDLATEGGKYGTQALGEVHQDTMGLLVSMAKLAFASCVRERIVKPLVRYNYGEAGLRVLPQVSFGETEQQDFKTTADGYASLKSAALLFPAHYNDMYEQLHMDALPEEFIAKLQAEVEATLEGNIQMAQDPTGEKAAAAAAAQQPTEEEAIQGEEKYW